MSDMADVLELLHTSPDRWDTLRLRGMSWRQRSGYHDAWERWVAAAQARDPGSASRRITITATAQGAAQPEETVHWRLWEAKPNKIRAEFDVGAETVKALLVGDHWWSWTPSRGLRTNNGDPSSTHGVGPAAVLIDTPPLLSSLSLRSESRTTYLSRATYVASGRPLSIDRNRSPNLVQHALGPGADRYELVVDAEIGILLRTQAEWRRDPFYVLEVEDLGVNEPIDESVFTPDALVG